MSKTDFEKMNKTDFEKMKEELKWIQIREEHRMSFFEKLKSKGILGLLVPVGCLATTGVLLSGLYQMTKRNGRMQQLLMRYRVGVQGVTVILTLISLMAVPLNNPK